jgi:hypothetical protein
MKNTLGLLLLACAVFGTRPAAASIIPFDNQCFVKLYQPNGKVKKALVERKAAVRVSKDLNAGFIADYFGGKPTEAIFYLQDAHTKEYDILTSTIVYDWSWNFERETKYGHVTVECE